MRRAALRLALAAALLAPAAPDAAGQEPIRIAFLGTLSGPLGKAGEEAHVGVRAAAEAWSAKRPVEVALLDDREDPVRAGMLLGEAQRQKFAAVVAAPTALTVEAVANQARRGRTPVVFVGTAPPRAAPDPEDPVIFVGPWPGDQALNAASALAIHSEKSGIGLYRGCLEPAVVAEDSDRGRELAEGLARNLGPRQHLSGKVLVPPHGKVPAEEVKRLRAARCDRIVLFGEPDLVDRTVEAMRGIGWEVPLFCGDGMLSRASTALHDGSVRRANFLWGAARKALAGEGPAPELAAFVGRHYGAGAPVYTRSVNGWFAARMVLQAAEAARRPAGSELLAALRALSYTKEEEWGRPLLDEAGRTALYHWFLWTMGDGGPEPVKPSYLPTRDLGPMMLQKKPGDWDGVPVGEGTRVVWLTFGEAEPRVRSDPARTIEEDVTALGLGTRGYEAEMDPWILDDLMARTLGKVNRLFLKNYDGTSVPGVSFDIHFTARKPEHMKNGQYWTAIIAGKNAGVEAGGMVLGGGKVAVYSRWIRENTAIKEKRLSPTMSREDRPYLDGSYPWGTQWEQNVRSDMIRALIDGYASYFALTTAHELGHVLSCGHDRESDRSIMNVVEGAGARDTQACWIPAHTKLIEGQLGRWPGKGR